MRVVAGLLFSSVSLAVYNARDSFLYALPAAACLFAAVWMRGEGADAAWVCAALLAAALGCAQFVIATVRRMINAHLSPTYREAMRWTHASTDFFVFIFLGFAAMAALSLFLAGAAALLYEYSFTVSSAWMRRVAEDEYGAFVIRTSFLLVIFGSRVLAAAALALAAAMWGRLCRVGIQIPAHVEGYYLSPREALDATRGRGWHLLALSLILNFGLSGLAGALGAGMERSFAGEAPPWARGALAAAGLWAAGLLNAGYWTAAYREHASGHIMRREIY